ncbi:L-seryl-tRNA(Sec) selenium transferase [Desulfobulbus alkaliphilus]|uniref:L-seryl-tRNA(Sec) selenium transferase n=1 Tax=Desulfobulbus alkaliphilus TaxID=869814 RepID=UPI0019648D7A|nr:L-seryl-tRNA(Sec) selenium transferase [Desulfobulbus alkaliphilus]MBM9537960.1 L-seryl-tRNA(Sec) selenium transferase [Desulfobulbus alkaliphilus]
MDSVSRSLRMIPNVNECLHSFIESGDLDDVPLSRLKYCTRIYLEKTRQEILRGDHISSSDRTSIIDGLKAFVRRYHRPRLERVVNGTGVIVHTNLGRSLLPSSSTDALLLAGQNYTNLEFDLETGKRGSRYAHVEDLLCELTGAEAALVVNNNAAAVLLALETLAKNKEVVVSRGQLIEIGGSFRIPDIMKRSGALLVETGTTNRTRIEDYRGAVTNETALLLRVHCSNYRIIGFTSEVSGPELVQLGKSLAVPVMEDLGSGCFIDLSRFGLAKEPTVQETVASGMGIVTFSGDKLLGGPQAGLILGKRIYIEQIKKNPLNRAVRIDKFTLAALESILRLYLDETLAVREIPTLAMIASPEQSVRERAKACQQRLAAKMKDLCSVDVVQVDSRVGGGAMPEQNIPSWAVALRPAVMTIHQLEKSLRRSSVPVIGRVENDLFLLDMRTVRDDELALIVEGLLGTLVVAAGGEQKTYPGEK